MNPAIAQQTLEVMMRHIRQHHDRLDALALDVITAIEAHRASVRDVVALIGFLLARAEHHDFAVHDVLAALLLAHERREAARRAEAQPEDN